MESDRRLTLNEIHTGHLERPTCGGQTNGRGSRSHFHTLAARCSHFSKTKEKLFKIESRKFIVFIHDKYWFTLYFYSLLLHIISTVMHREKTWSAKYKFASSFCCSIYFLFCRSIFQETKTLKLTIFKFGCIRLKFFDLLIILAMFLFGNLSNLLLPKFVFKNLLPCVAFFASFVNTNIQKDYLFYAFFHIIFWQ